MLPSTYGVDFYGDSLFTHQRLVDRNPDLVQRFIQASLNGWMYALENPESIAYRIARELPRIIAVDDFKSFNHFQDERVRKLILYPIVPVGHTNPDRWRRMHTFLKQSGIVEGDLDLDKFIFVPIKRKQIRAKEIQRLLVIGLLMVLLGAVAFLLWIWMLKRLVSSRTKKLKETNEQLHGEITERKKAEEELRKYRDHLEEKVEQRTIELERTNEQLEQEITEHKQAEKALREANTKLNTLIETIPDAVYFKDAQGRNIVVNKALEKLVGLEREKILGKNDEQFLPPEMAELCRKSDEEVIKRRKPIRIEEQMTDDKGERLCLETIKCPILDDQENIRGLIGISRDITERKKAEEQIKASLREKEVLLREIHHRVKNNMQVITSLLKLQSRHIKDKRYIEMFKESQNRIKSMALIHEKLYQSKDLSCINFCDYIKNLANDLFRTYVGRAGRISLEMDLGNVYLGIDNAIPLGLIISELVSNSLKHAFSEGRRGKIKISLNSTDENEIELMVSDNGVGIPEDLDFRDIESLGLKLVTGLAEEQLEGKIELNRDEGTEFRIKFREIKNM